MSGTRKGKWGVTPFQKINKTPDNSCSIIGL